MAKKKLKLLSIARRIDKKSKKKIQGDVDLSNLAERIDREEEETREDDVSERFPSSKLKPPEDQKEEDTYRPDYSNIIPGEEERKSLPTIPDTVPLSLKDEVSFPSIPDTVPLSLKDEIKANISLPSIPELSAYVNTIGISLPSIGKDHKEEDNVTGTSFALPDIQDSFEVRKTTQLSLPDISQSSESLKQEPINLPDMPGEVVTHEAKEYILPSIHDESVLSKGQTISLPSIQEEMIGRGNILVSLPSIPESIVKWGSPIVSLPSIPELEAAKDKMPFILPTIQDSALMSADRHPFVLPQIQEIMEGFSEKPRLILPTIPELPPLQFTQFNVPLSVASSIDEAEEMTREKEKPYDATPALRELALGIDKYTEATSRSETIIPQIPTQSAIGEYWEKVVVFGNASLNTGLDSADIPDNHSRTATHVIFDNDVAEKAKGASLYNTSDQLGAATYRKVGGVFRSHNKTGDRALLAACNGVISCFPYDYPSSAMTNVYTGLTTVLDSNSNEVLYSFINHNDKTYIVNGYDDALEFNPRTKTCIKLGLEPLRFYQKVAYFESNETITQETATAAADTNVFRIEERTGHSRTSLKLTASAGGVTPKAYIVPTEIDLSTYPNGANVSDDDFIVLSVFHRERAYVQYIYVQCWTSPGNTYTATIDVSSLDPIYQRDNQWTQLLIRRSNFVSAGSPSWASVNRVYFYFTSVTGGTSINIDNVYIKNAPIEATQYRVTVDDFEGALSGWTVSAGTATDNWNVNYIKEKTKSLKWTGSADATILKNTASTLNLGTFSDGIASQTSDEICLWMYASSTANLVKITLYLYNLTDESKGYFYDYPVANMNQTSSGAATDLRVKKSAFTDIGAPTGWNSITRIKIGIDVSGSCTLYFDMFRLEEYRATKDIATMETSETWNFSGASHGGFNNLKKYVSRGDYSIYLKTPKNASYTADTTLALTDLTLFGAAEISGTDDLICFWMHWTVFTSIRNVEIRVDCSDATPDYETNYYSYILSPSKLEELCNMSGLKSAKKANRGIMVEIKKSDFTKVGTSANAWDDVYGVRFIVSTASKGTPVTIFFDNLHMRRQTGLYGIYQFCTIGVTSDGIKSAPSEWSTQVTLSGTKGLLSKVPVSADANCVARWIYRKGGSLGEYARRDTIINDNTTTAVTIYIDDMLTGSLLDSSDIPQGTIRVPLASRWCLALFQGRGILYRDLSHLRRLYYSNIGYLNCWSELQAYDFEDDIKDVYVKEDILFVNTVSGIKKISEDLGTLSPNLIQETGLVKPSISPFGSCQVDDVRGFTSYDGFYLFNGYQYKKISDEVKDKFDSGSYDIDNTRAIYRNNHLYISIITTGGTRYLLDCYIPKMAWRLSDYVAQSLCIFDGQGDNNEIYMGDVSGYIYRLEPPSTYAQTSVLETKDFTSPDQFRELIVRGVDVIARSASTFPGYLNLKFRVDQVQNDSIILTFPEFATVEFSGSGVLNDMTCGAAAMAAYNLTIQKRFKVKITTVGTPDKFKYSINNGDTWSAETNLAATNTLESAIVISWGATTGHTLNDEWTFTVSHLKSTYGLYRSHISGDEDYIKGNMIGVRIYPGVNDKHFAVRMLRIWGEIAPIEKNYEEGA